MAERLPGVDAGFLYMETPTQHMHTLKVAFLDVSAAPGGYSFEAFTAGLGQRLHLLPPFRRRLRSVPWQLHHPVWVEDQPVDMPAHVHRVVVPSPGTRRQVEQVIGEIASTPLDRSRPLWEISVLEGLDDGTIGVVAKMHHAVADGAAASALLANVMDTDYPLELPAWQPVPPPESRQLVTQAVADQVRQLLRLPALLLRTLRSVLLLVRRRRDMPVLPPRPILDTPKVSFNGAITGRRSFATTSLSLVELRKVRAAAGVTFNDVVLGVVAGALRRWLDDRDEHPSSSLTAGVPVATDRAGPVARLAGNRVSNMFTSLCTDVDDPVQRLQDIARVTAQAKVMQETLGLQMLENWVQYTPPALFTGFMRLYSRLHGADHHRAPFNVVVSNVPGPTESVSVGGARLTDLYSVGPIMEGIGLNITVWSYLDRLNFSGLACPDTLADLPGLMKHLAPALAELTAATGAARGASA
ncbi:MAG: wax ester/triacylglycerol synthase family O-acyltransferase [Frankiales bacterium]|nr:wax ester/triacylglycerol synthase family O-acyltransferase [Frankiales bacterium]